MKTAFLLFLALALLVSHATNASAQYARLAIRQDSAAPTPSESIASPRETTAKVSGDATSASDAPQPTSKDGSSEAQDKPSQAPGSSSGASNSSSAASDEASSTKPPATTTLKTITSSVSSTSLPQPTQAPVAPGIDALPIQPIISPGLAVAGVLLLGFGIAYTFVGIRQKWFHIFCAVMYLVALAITVLLVYVANPPVSSKVQGAYLVAAFVPGVIIAAASLIFKEIVEGLGCLLGGFCFAMWLLCLAPGGLIHSNGGRVGLIVAFSGAFFALSFSHYTRTYGLIGCIAFAGATSIVLGIDCFSRAGLKEFWIYNWDLNALIFPLDTKSYPTTRGIKVESAVIVIIAIFGVMSQMKLWNVIKERRAEREKARLQDEEDREHLEADLGRRIEKTNRQEKARWEEVYDGKLPNSSASMTGSTMASTYELGANSRSESVRELPSSFGHHERNTSNTNSMEMQDLSGQGGAAVKRDSRERSSIIVTHTEVPEGPDAVRRHHRTNTLERLEAGIVEHPSHRTSASEAPAVEPLPFTVPAESATRIRSNSVTTNGADMFDDSHRVPIATKRASDPRHSQRISRSTMGEELNIPHDDDRASSLAATFDGLTDEEDEGLPKLSRPASPSQTKQNPEIVLPKRTRSLSSKDTPQEQTRASLRVPSDAKLDNRKSMPSIEDLPNMQNGSEDALFAPSTNLADTLKLKTKPSADSESQGSSAARRASLKKEFLPQDQPSVASIYRTNEWAKHQASADIPSMEDIAPPSEEGVSVDYGKETSAPLDIFALQQTALSGREPRVRSSSQLSSTNPYRNGAVQRSNSQSSLQQQPQQQPSIDIPSTSPTLGQGPTMQRAPSQTRVNSMRSGMLSTPLLSQPLIESPIEELPEIEPRIQRSMSQQQMYSQPSSSATLLGRREDMLNARKSSTMLPGSESNPNLPGALNRSQTALSRQPVRQSSAPIARTDSVYSNFNHLPEESRQTAQQGDSQSIYQGHLNQQQDADMDDMPLSQRKEMIRRSSLSQVGIGGLQRNDSQYTLGAPVSPVNGPNPHQGIIYDAHTPKRGPSFHADHAQARMANWRSDLQADERMSRTQSILLAQSQDEALNRLREERRARGEAEQRREIERSAQQGALDERMRSGNMLRTHAEVMRKMQRSARAD